MSQFSPGDKVVRRLSTGAPLITTHVWVVVDVNERRIKIRSTRDTGMIRSVNPANVERAPEEEL